MKQFISTTGGKIVNTNAIAFLTSRTKANPGTPGEDVTQLVIGFSAAGIVSQGGLMPLTLVMQGDEALEFLGQLERLGIEVDSLRNKIS
ncbi:MAG: hypothetical protein ABL994_14090 [Verrucomicrobiales bacterium]